MKSKNTLSSDKGSAWQPLKGGMINTVFRKKGMVKRPLGRWSPATHHLLKWLSNHDFDQVPKLIQVTESEEILSYIEGEAIFRPWPNSIKQDEWMTELAQWLLNFQKASQGFQLGDQMAFIWGPKEPESHMVVCHGDLGLWNCIHQNGVLQGVIDWDLARFGHALDDLAQLALAAVPLNDSATAAFGRKVADKCLYGRLKRLCDEYGACTPYELIQHLLGYIDRIARETQELADQDIHPFVSFIERDFIDGYKSDMEYIQEHWLGSSSLF